MRYFTFLGMSSQFGILSITSFGLSTLQVRPVAPVSKNRSAGSWTEPAGSFASCPESPKNFLSSLPLGFLERAPSTLPPVVGLGHLSTPDAYLSRALLAPTRPGIISPAGRHLHLLPISTL